MPNQCSKTIEPPGLNFPRPRRCKKAGKVKRNGKWYCTQHDPEKEGEREKKKAATKEKRDKMKKIQYYAKLANKNKLNEGGRKRKKDYIEFVLGKDGRIRDENGYLGFADSIKFNSPAEANAYIKEKGFGYKVVSNFRWELKKKLKKMLKKELTEISQSIPMVLPTGPRPRYRSWTKADLEDWENHQYEIFAEKGMWGREGSNKLVPDDKPIRTLKESVKKKIRHIIKEEFFWMLVEKETKWFKVKSKPGSNLKIATGYARGVKGDEVVVWNGSYNVHPNFISVKDAKKNLTYVSKKPIPDQAEFEKKFQWTLNR